MAESNSPPGAVDQVAVIPRKHWHDKSPERPNSCFIAVKLLSLLALAFLFASGACGRASRRPRSGAMMARVSSYAMAGGGISDGR
jgi:hypothetical protein